MGTSEFLNVNENGLSIGLATPPPEVLLTPNIGVIGVGGAGGNAVNNMISSELTGVSFFAANTDARALSKSLVADKIQLGVNLTKGLGAGANPEVGKAAANETAEKIKEYLQGFHLLFITAGMGGGTGTGAAPVIAKLAKDMGILTVGVVSKPFRFEGSKRMRTAEAGIAELQKNVDTLIVIPNQNLFRIAGDHMTFAEAFKIADDVLCQGVRSITDLVMTPGLINLDFADVKTVISSMGRAMMGTGEAEGEGRAERAAEQAISNPLLDDSTVKGAKSILINVSGGLDLTLNEVDTATERIVAELDPDANIIFGTCIDENLHGKIRVSLVATGIERTGEKTIVEPTRPVVQETIVSVPTVSEISDVLSDETSPEEAQPTLIQTTVVVADHPREELYDRPLKTVNVAVEVVNNPEITQPPLLAEEVPVIAESVPIRSVPEIKEAVNMESKKADANVKTIRSGLFDFVPGFMNKSAKSREKEQTSQQTNQVFDDPFDNVDLPAFLRRR